MATTDIDEASARSDERRRMAEHRAEVAARRAQVAHRNADKARNEGKARAAAVHDQEAAIHQRAVDIHRHAARVQQNHRRELEGASGAGIDEDGLRLIADSVRRAREEAELRGQQARTFALRARERAARLHGEQRRDAGDV
ncbi:MAG: hypothetical protein ACTHNU_16430 [Gaiellales bacterium]